MQWDNLFASRAGTMKRSTIRQFLKLTNEPDMISFAGGLPAAELLPTDEVAECVGRVIKHFGSSALQYGATEGVSELRDWIAKAFSNEQLAIGRDNVLIVTGAQQGLDMIGRVFLDPGDTVAVENPTYLAALLAWRPLGVSFTGVRGDHDGMDMSHFEAVLHAKPKLAYVVPNFQNPQGTTLALNRRQQVADLLAHHRVPLIEDDPYRELRFEGADLPSIFSLQKDGAEGNTLYVGTFSKVVAPGLRVGWVMGPAVVLEKLLLAKQAMDLHTSTFNQYLVWEMLRSDNYQTRLAGLRESYRARRDAMLVALAEHFPAEVTWSRPDGGMFLFARLPERLGATDLLSAAINQRVIFVPGADFHVDGTGQNTMRLNFTRHGPDMIYEGIRRLGRIVTDALARGR
jgi:2-aminoadipate transaminase